MLLSRSSMCWNPFVISDEQHKNLVTCTVDNFFFYDHKEQKIVASSQWFGSNNDYKELEILPNTELKRKIKIDLSLAVPFYIPAKCQYEKRIDIYIPVALLPDFQILHHIHNYSNKMESSYKDRASFTAKGIKYQYNLEKREWFLPDAQQELKVEFECNYTFEKTDLFKKLQRYSEKAKQAGVNLSTYDLEKLQDIFNITEKRNTSK